MKIRPKRLISIFLLLSGGSACFGVGLPAKDEGSFHPGDWTAVNDDRLEETRGGFDAGSGLTVSFGIIRTVNINGDLVNRTSFELPDVTRITADQARLVSSAMADAGIIQNGSGNTIDPNVAAHLDTGTIIQNSLSNQNIQTLTVINAGVNSLSILKSINIQSALKDALFGSLGIR